MGRTGLMLLAGLLGACLLAGCGGGGGGAVTPATGSAVFHLEWPTANLAPPVRGQAPAEAQSMRIDMVGVSGASKVAQRPTTEVRFDGLPVGRRQYVATALDAQQQQLAQAQGVLTIEQAKAASATLSGEVAAVSVLVVAQLQVGDTYQVEKGKTLQLVVCAVTAEGKVVLVAPDSFAWSSDDEAVATVDSTGKVTGVSVGTAQVTASFNSGQVEKAVSVEVIDRGVTGRWESTLTGAAGGAAGAMGMLLTQSGTTVSGSVAQYPLANGRFSNGQLTGTFTANNGAVYDLSLKLAADGKTLAGNLVRHYQSDTDTIPVTATRLSGVPENPDLTPPAVNATSPASNATGVARSNLEIRITWSKPVNGWDAELSGVIGGLHMTIGGNDLIDSSQCSYDPDTHIYTMHVKSSILLNAGTAYVLKLDGGDDVDWHDAYGVPAWETVGGAYTINFTTGNN